MSVEQGRGVSRREWLVEVGAAAAVAAVPIVGSGCVREVGGGKPRQGPAGKPRQGPAGKPRQSPAGKAASTPGASASTRPTLSLRPSAERGRANHGWLDARHSFSFARYHDPKHMSYRALRVLNEDRIQAGRGFPLHPHRDMEIITYVLDGALQHKDSLGNGSIIRPGEVQRMTAGTGIQHSEFEPSRSRGVHLLQIWIAPDRRGHTPSYEQKPVRFSSVREPVRLVASPNGKDGSVRINQDASVYACKLTAGQSMRFDVRPERHLWIQVARGGLTDGRQKLEAGDGASTSELGTVELAARQASELLLFDLA